MSARDDILANIRRSLGVRGTETIRRQVVADRLERITELETVPAEAERREAP